MAEVLAEHQLDVNTSHGDAWQPPEESASCSCGVDLGGWVASGADWEWPDGWGKEHSEHVAAVLAADGYGKLEDAWNSGYNAACQDSPNCEVPCGACEQCMSPQTPNPHRVAELLRARAVTERGGE